MSRTPRWKRVVGMFQSTHSPGFSNDAGGGSGVAVQFFADWHVLTNERTVQLQSSRRTLGGAAII